jgi:hypothetical protein
VMERVIKVKMNIFITLESESSAVRGGWSAETVLIQCFNFG